MTDTRRAPSQRWLDLGERQRAAVAKAVVDVVSADNTTLTIADLADRAGISRPTFYKYFPTLGAAVLHTASVLIAELEAFIEERHTEQPNAREELLARFALSFEYARTHPEITVFFSFYDFTFRRLPLTPDERAVRDEIAHMAGDPFHALFVAGQEEGSIDRSLPTDVTYLAFITSMTGTSQRLVIETDWTTGDDERARGVHETLIALWRAALQPQS
jgi:AcrR family transcriptional regulator